MLPLLPKCTTIAPMTKNASRTARDRARAELTAEITTTARRHLAEHGPVALSLRAVARELGMASSALYRYFPSRDALLTQLIVDAYDDLGDACDEAVAETDEDDLLGRWRAIASAVRNWSKANPHEYALIYGSPVPGYAAPPDTIDPASRILRHLITLSIAIDETDAAKPSPVTVAATLERQIATLLDDENALIDRQRLLTITSAWALLFGTVSFEVFGRYSGMFDDADELFNDQVTRSALTLGLSIDP